MEKWLVQLATQNRRGAAVLWMCVVYTSSFITWNMKMARSPRSRCNKTHNACTPTRTFFGKNPFFPPSECVAVKNTVTSSYFVSTSLVCVQACRHSHGGKQHFCIVLKIVLTSWTKENLRKFHGYWDGYKVIWSKLRIHVSALSL